MRRIRGFALFSLSYVLRFFYISLFRYFATSLLRYFVTSLLRYFATSLLRYFATSLLHYFPMIDIPIARHKGNEINPGWK